MTEYRKSLTHFERTCLQLVANGKAVGSIAQQRGESPAEIESLLASARHKLAANTNVEAIARALKLGLIE
jgi:DNA-binding CsgD family transcriptional regulator